MEKLILDVFVLVNRVMEKLDMERSYLYMFYQHIGQPGKVMN